MADRRRLVRLALLGLVGGAALPLAFFGFARLGRPRPARSLARSPDARVRALAPLYTPFAETAWSSNHPEERDQTLTEFVAQNPPRAPDLRTLYIQPLGAQSEDSRKLIAETAALLGVWFDRSVKTLPPISLAGAPATARRGTQWLTAYLLDGVLRPRRPADALAVLAVLDDDVTPGKGWNFVFGQASLRERVGVWSLHRLRYPRADSARLRRRFFQIATHETGHMLGLPHCLAARCGMNGTNSRMDLDSGTLAFCPECAAKLWHAAQIEPTAWYARLETFAQARDLPAEAALWKASRGIL